MSLKSILAGTFALAFGSLVIVGFTANVGLFGVSLGLSLVSIGICCLINSKSK
jgi:hypothetical protein